MEPQSPICGDETMKNLHTTIATLLKHVEYVFELLKRLTPRLISLASSKAKN